MKKILNNFTVQAGGSRHTSYSQNKYEGRGGYHKVKRGRVKKVVMEKETLTKRTFLTKLQLNLPSSVTPDENADREFDCLFCKLYTHKTKDCKKITEPIRQVTQIKHFL